MLEESESRYPPAEELPEDEHHEHRMADDGCPHDPPAGQVPHPGFDPNYDHFAKFRSQGLQGDGFGRQWDRNQPPIVGFGWVPAPVEGGIDWDEDPCVRERQCHSFMKRVMKETGDKIAAALRCTGLKYELRLMVQGADRFASTFGILQGDLIRMPAKTFCELCSSPIALCVCQTLTKTTRSSIGIKID